MEALIEYIKDALGLDIKLQSVPENELSNLPFYIRKAFQFVHGNLLDQPLLLLEFIGNQEPSIQQIAKQLETIKETLDRTPVIVIEDIFCHCPKEIDSEDY